MRPPDLITPSAFRFRVAFILFGANMGGAFLCTFYFVFLDQPVLSSDTGEALLVSLIMALVLLIAGTGASIWLQLDLDRTLNPLFYGKELPADLLARARKKS